MSDFFNDRRPAVDRDDRPLERGSLREANAKIRAATPVYRAGEVNRKIRTTAVKRHRARRSGNDDFSSVSEYVEFILGAGDER